MFTFQLYGDPVLVEAGCGKFPRYPSLAHIRLKFHDIVPKLSSLAVTQSKLTEVINSRQDLRLTKSTPFIKNCTLMLMLMTLMMLMMPMMLMMLRMLVMLMMLMLMENMTEHTHVP